LFQLFYLTNVIYVISPALHLLLSFYR